MNDFVIPNVWLFFSSEWDEIIKTRVVGFTWCDDFISFPDDPYGRQGPTLDQILHKPKITAHAESKSK